MPAPLRFRLATLDDLTIDDRSSFSRRGGLRAPGRARAPLGAPLPHPGGAAERELGSGPVPQPHLLERGRRRGRALRRSHPRRRRRPRGVARGRQRELARRQRRRRGPADAAPPPPSAGALFLAESIASAFDLYLVGRLLPNAPECDFVTTQVPLMAECAGDAGLPEPAFSALLEDGRARAGARVRGSAGAAVRRGERAAGVPRRRAGPRARSKASPIAASRRCCTTTSSRTGSSMRAPTRPARSAATRSPARWTRTCGRRRSRSTGWTVTSSKPP